MVGFPNSEGREESRKRGSSSAAWKRRLSSIASSDSTTDSEFGIEGCISTMTTSFQPPSLSLVFSPPLSLHLSLSLSIPLSLSFTLPPCLGKLPTSASSSCQWGISQSQCNGETNVRMRGGGGGDEGEQECCL